MICAVVVTFNPDLERFARVLEALAPQVGRIHVVDNGSGNVLELAALLAPMQTATITPLGVNRGVGAALNRGIEATTGCQAVLLMDQDSIPSSAMVENLVRGIGALRGQGHRVAAIGPRFLDRHSGNLSQHVVFVGWRVGRKDCVSVEQPVAVDYLITSGSLIPIEALQDVGLFDESLFVDHIDTDWILRAKKKGYSAYGDCSAVMEHDLGEYRRRIWLGRWREVPIHKPFRYYYIFRNSIWLRGRSYASKEWKRADATRLVQIFGFMTLFHPERFAVVRMMALGLADGIRGRLGPESSAKR